jgi:histidinol-phosphate phosphatase family protein
MIPGVPEAVSKLNKAGYKVIVVTNQSGISRGLFDVHTLMAVNKRMAEMIEAGGGYLDDLFYCPHCPEEKCSCRKPETAMGIEAILKHNIDPSRSFMIGDSDRDIEFGERLGLRSYQVTEKRQFPDIVKEILSGRS